MSPIPDEIIEQVRDAADIVTVVGEHVDLRRTGTDYRGACPFHGGTHRNFAVIPKKQMYYCFVCHEGGDVFTFFMKKFGMEYPAAVREVASKCGISIPERPTGGPDPREPLYSAVSVAGEWYTRRLREGTDAGAARRYLEERGFDLEQAVLLGMGYAPKGSHFLDAMQKLGVTPEVLLEAGLTVRRDDGRVRARFWNRLLFPIHDLRGRVVGFGGRVIGEGEPKYLNSPDSPIFHKGGLLYNLHHAKPAIRKAERAIVVEGYFDALRLVEVGIEEVVAPLGTGLTPDQAKLLKRFTKNVTLFYDSDAAGLRASFRAADELLRQGLRVTIGTLPPGEDPDTLVTRGGAEAAHELLRDALDVLERKLQLLELKGWMASLTGRRKALDRLLPTLRAVSDPVTRDLYVNRTAEALGVARSSVERELEGGRWQPSWGARPVDGEGGSRETGARSSPGRHEPELQLLRVMLHTPEWRARIAERIEQVGVRDGAAWRLLAALAAAPTVSGSELLAQVDEDARRLLTELVAEEWEVPNVDAFVEGALNRLESRSLGERVERIDRRMPVASEEEKLELIREKQQLSRRRREIDPADWNVIRGGRSSAR